MIVLEEFGIANDLAIVPLATATDVGCFNAGLLAAPIPAEHNPGLNLLESVIARRQQQEEHVFRRSQAAGEAIGGA